MDKSSLLTALKLASPALGRSNLIQGLDCFSFKDSKIEAYNGSLAIIVNLESSPGIVGRIPGEALVKVLNELPTEIALSQSEEKNELTVRSISSKVVFPVLSSAIELFSLPPTSDDDIKLPPTALFANGIKQCLASLGKSMGISEVGIALFLSKENCELYSTNGITMSKYNFPLDDAFHAVPINVFLPAAFCENFAYLFSEQLTCPNEIAIGSSYIRAVFPNVGLYQSFYATPVKASMKGLFSSIFSKVKLVPIPKGLPDAVRRVEVITSTIGNYNVEIKYSNTSLVMSAKGTGDIVETLEIEYPSEGSISIDIRNLHKILDQTASIGFGKDCIVLVGSDPLFQHIITTKSL